MYRMPFRILMRDYQRQKNNKYILPRAQYHRTLWLIRDYYRIVEEVKYIAESGPGVSDGMPKGNRTSDPTSDKAIRAGRMIDIINLIDDERSNMPEEYQRGVWENIMYGTAYPMDADRSTYGRVKSKFVYNIAKRMEKL